MESIILASSSPRRQEILKFLGIPFIVMPPEIDETVPPEISPEASPEYLAARKVDAIARKISVDNEISWILSADTLVIHKGKTLGKPSDLVEAKRFLEELQGDTHTVVTGIALFNGAIHDISLRTSINKVTFAPMTEDEIQWYLSTDEWHGAAGAYRIQGLASCFIKEIKGTESSVMGLPIRELYDMLLEQNYRFAV